MERAQHGRSPRAAVADQPGFLRGSVIYFGKYELLSRINIGGMAEIVKARDTSVPHEQLVAIKRILPHLCDDQLYRAMFLDESRVLAQVQHASIIDAFEIGEIDDTPYIALEYIHGQDARALFHEAREGSQRIPIAIAGHVITRVCEGLHHAHEQTDANGQLLGIVHRDVSLQNILISYDGDVKLTDFGIAVSAENVARTDLGVVKGKFGYMSPEQIKGAPLDRRSDVFSVGICLYELLTGERLFSGENDYKAVERVRNAEVEPPSVLNRQIPSRLERIVMKALSKHPRDRYQSTNDLRRALQSFMADANEFISADDLGAYMRDVFAAQLASEGVAVAPAARAAIPELEDESASGLEAFDDLEPVKALAFANPSDEVTAVGPTPVDDQPEIMAVAPAAVAPSRSGGVDRGQRVRRAPGRPAPSVPPLIPSMHSIPVAAPHHHNQGPVAELQVGAPVQRFDMEWDEEEPTTISQGFQDAPNLANMRSRDATRPMPYDLAPLPAVEDDMPESDAAESGPKRRSIPTLEIPKAPSTFNPLWVAGAFALAASALVVYLTHDRGVATLRLETDPKDAMVSVDGQHATGVVSPFVISELSAGVNHTIVVEKPGYVSWSTRLRVRPDKTFELPLVKLEKLPSSAPTAVSDPGVTASPMPTGVMPPLNKKQASAAARDAAREAARDAKEAARARRELAAAHRAERPAARRPPAPNASPRVGAAPAATAPKSVPAGMGTLRINTRPWSRVTIDGRLVGNTPQMNLQLRAGSHTVTLNNPDFGVSKTLQIEIKPDATVTRVLTLVP